jgi:hypothetical protein
MSLRGNQLSDFDHYGWRWAIHGFSFVLGIALLAVAGERRFTLPVAVVPQMAVDHR